MVEIYHTINLQKKLNYFFGKKKKIGVVIEKLRN